MKFSGLAARTAAFGAAAAMLATLTAGLVAGPAQAATGKAPKVVASAPTAKPSKFEGSCPVKVNFSAKIKVPVKGKTKLVYRWLHGDGSKSKVSVVNLKGHGSKWVTVRQAITFKDDVKGWEAVQVLSPKKYTSKKGYFSVSCEKPREYEVYKPSHPNVSAHAWANPDEYVGICTPGDKIGFTGLIRVDRPTWVRYRWVLNGDVVDYGKVKVYDARKVGFSFSPRHSQRGWAQLEILGPDREYSNRAYYKVWCKEPAPAPKVKVWASSLVTETNHDGCKVGAHASINTTGPAKVQWVWSVNGESVLKGEAYFGGSGAKTVSLGQRPLFGDAAKGGTVTLSVFGPHNGDRTSQTYAACEAPKTPAPQTPAPAPSPAVTEVPKETPTTVPAAA